MKQHEIERLKEILTKLYIQYKSGQAVLLQEAMEILQTNTERAEQ